MTTGRINQVAIVTPPRDDISFRKKIVVDGGHTQHAPTHKGDGGAKSCRYVRFNRSSITTTEMLRRRPRDDDQKKLSRRTSRNTPHHTGLADSSTSANSNDAEAKRPRHAGRYRNASRAQPPAGAAVAPAMTHRRATAQRRRSECDTDWLHRAVANVCTSCSDTSASSGGSRQALRQAWGAQERTASLSSR